MLTGTIVIDKFCKKPSLKICLLRTFSRGVPFESFSCFGPPSRGWHDRLTDTYVVKKHYAIELKNLLIRQNALNLNIQNP